MILRTAISLTGLRVVVVYMMENLPDEMIVLILCSCATSVDLRNLSRTCRRMYKCSKEKLVWLSKCEKKIEEIKASRSYQKALRWAFYQGCTTMIEMMMGDVRAGKLDLDDGITGAVTANRLTLIRRYTSISFRRSFFCIPNTLSQAIKPYVCTSKVTRWLATLTEVLIKIQRGNGRGEKDVKLTLEYLTDLLKYEVGVGNHLARRPLTISIGKCTHEGCPNSIDLVDDF